MVVNTFIFCLRSDTSSSKLDTCFFRLRFSDSNLELYCLPWHQHSCSYAASLTASVSCLFFFLNCHPATFFSKQRNRLFLDALFRLSFLFFVFSRNKRRFRFEGDFRASEILFFLIEGFFLVRCFFFKRVEVKRLFDVEFGQLLIR